MRIQIQDDNQNWLNWGMLVRSWILDTTRRPTNVGELKSQLTKYSVIAAVAGADQRAVAIESYDNNPHAPLEIVIPTVEMLNDKLKTVTSGRYPLPLFYDIAFAGAARASLSPQESLDFALRRIGEYTVNECC